MQAVRKDPNRTVRTRQKRRLKHPVNSVLAEVMTDDCRTGRGRTVTWMSGHFVMVRLVQTVPLDEENCIRGRDVISGKAVRGPIDRSSAVSLFSTNTALRCSRQII